MSLSGIDGVLFILFPFSTAQVDVLSDEFINSINKAQSFWRAGKVWPENTTSEFLERLSGSVDPNLYRHEYEDQIAHRPQFRLDANIPEAFDVREKWPQCKAIDKERSQGFCNSCWAHVVASAFTDVYCIASKGETNFEFSTEDILTCCGPECLADAARSCTGGRVDKAWDYLVEQGGVSGGEYKSRDGCKPYSKDAYVQANISVCKHACTNRKYNVSYEADKRFARNKTVLFSKNIKEIQNEIMNNGPVVAHMAVYKDFQTYKEGVYVYTTGQKDPSYHAVKLIGWGVEGVLPYWLGVNTWGKEWGMKGVFKIIKGKDECGIESSIFIGMPDVNRIGFKRRAPETKMSTYKPSTNSFSSAMSPSDFIIFVNISILYKHYLKSAN